MGAYLVVNRMSRRGFRKGGDWKRMGAGKEGLSKV